MLDQKPEDVSHVCCIGAGPIGGGWAAHYLAQGYRVTSYLHDIAEHDALMRLLDTAWLSLTEIGLSADASLDNFSWTTDLTGA
ncbi:MAG: 3-hydroxybutyryl-CoA dehydrogenase, partial [Gammaproteobacteria bacterium]|nr:3-hydroxybutyryl-CoA dehydrogenase [Gammaproteobacteria bacterium]